MNHFRLAFFVEGRIVTVSEPMDLIDGLASERAFLAKGYPARLMTDSRSLTRLHAQFALQAKGQNASIAIFADGEVQITTPHGPVPDIAPRELSGPLPDEVAQHTPGRREREGKDGPSCGD